MAETNIAWTQNSWNPLSWNCTPIGPECAHCYAMELAGRYSQNANEGKFLATPTLRERAFAELPKLKPGPTFVCSMSDLFHKDVPSAWIHRIMNSGRFYPYLTLLCLTKRIERARGLAPYLDWGKTWIGTSIGHVSSQWRLEELRAIRQAAGRFVSFEPLIGPLFDVDLEGIDWVIVGGESGNQRRPFQRSWVEPIFEEAQRLHIPFFFKQGSFRYPGNDRLFHGQEWNEVPAVWGWQKEHKHAPIVESVQLAMFEERV